MQASEFTGNTISDFSKQLTCNAQQWHRCQIAAATFPTCWTKTEQPGCWLAECSDVARI